MIQFMINGVIYTNELVNNEQQRTVQLSDREIYPIEETFCFDGKILKQIKKSASMADASKLPSWLTGIPLDYIYEDITLVEIQEDGKIVINDEFYDCRFHTVNDINACMNCLFLALRLQNPYVYMELTKRPYPQGLRINVHNLIPGMADMLTNPKKLTAIETMLKTNGVKFAYNAIQNNISISNGKKAMILSQSQLKSLKTLSMDEHVGYFQDMVSDKLISMDQLDELIQTFKYLIKFDFISKSDLCYFFSRFSPTLKEKNIKIYDMFSNVIKSYMTIHKLFMKYSYEYTPVTFNSLLQEYVDAIAMLPDDMASHSELFKTNNVRKYSVITTRNAVVMNNPRPEEFAQAIGRCCKLYWENSEYYIRPFKNEEELFGVAELYNNCLATYRDKIIEGAVLLCAFKKKGTEVEPNPEFVFELTPYLDVLEVSTYNNVEVTDPDALDAVQKFRDSKRYLLSNNRTVFRDMESEVA